MPVRYTWIHGYSALRTGEIAWCPRRILVLDNVQREHSGFFAVKVHFADGTTMISKPVMVLIRTTRGPYGYFWLLVAGDGYGCGLCVVGGVF